MSKTKFKSYEEFLSEQGSNPTAKYYDTLGRIEKEFRTQKSTYGKSAEALDERGLSTSGYASFLDDKSVRQRAAQLSDAQSTRQREEAQLRGGYESYLSNAKKQLFTIESRAQSAILSTETVDELLALDIAKGAGLSEERASAVAKRAVALNINKRKAAIMDYVRKQMISPESAVLYGEAYGLPAETLEELRAYAEKVQKRNGGVNLDEELDSYPTVTPNQIQK